MLTTKFMQKGVGDGSDDTKGYNVPQSNEKCRRDVMKVGGGLRYGDIFVIEIQEMTRYGGFKLWR